MKVRVHNDRQTGQMTVDYFNVNGKARFRRCLLQRVLLQAEEEVLLIIDTNQRIGPASAIDASAALTADGFEPVVMSIPVNPRQMLGFKFIAKKEKTSEKLIISDLKKRVPTEMAFDVLLNYDIALGFGPLKPLAEICDAVRAGEPLFGSEYFLHSLYDSILCMSVRSSFDICKQIKEAKDEMGI